MAHTNSPSPSPSPFSQWSLTPTPGPSQPQQQQGAQYYPPPNNTFVFQANPNASQSQSVVAQSIEPPKRKRKSGGARRKERAERQHSALVKELGSDGEAEEQQHQLPAKRGGPLNAEHERALVEIAIANWDKRSYNSQQVFSLIIEGELRKSTGRVYHSSQRKLETLVAEYRARFANVSETGEEEETGMVTAMRKLIALTDEEMAATAERTRAKEAKKQDQFKSVKARHKMNKEAAGTIPIEVSDDSVNEAASANENNAIDSADDSSTEHSEAAALQSQSQSLARHLPEVQAIRAKRNTGRRRGGGSASDSSALSSSLNEYVSVLSRRASAKEKSISKVEKRIRHLDRRFDAMEGLLQRLLVAHEGVARRLTQEPSPMPSRREQSFDPMQFEQDTLPIVMSGALMSDSSTGKVESVGD